MGGVGSGTGGGAGAGEMGAGLQMEDTGAVTEEEALRPWPPWPDVLEPDEAEEEEEEEEPVLDTAGGVNWPLLSDPVLSLAGDDFFFAGRTLALFPLCCCWRHLALRFLNHT